MMQPRSQSQHRRGRPPRPPPPPSSSPSPSPSPPSSPRRRRALRPRLTPRPLFEDFYGLTSSDEEKTEIERKGRKKLKLVTKIQSNNSNSNSKISEKKRRPMGRRHVAGSDLSNSSYVEDEGESEDEVKPLKKRRIGSSGEKLGFEGSSHHHEVRRNNAGPRTKGSVSGLSPKLMRTTPLPDRKALEEILDKLQKKDAYGVFAEPVNADELPDYYDVIEHPMDFGTVRRKLARNVYRSFEQFEDDVFLICSNAMQYNAPDTIYFRQAHSIQELARSKFQKLREEGLKDPEPDPNPKPVKLFKPVEKKQIKREQFETMHENNKQQHSFSNNKNDYNKKNREEKMKKIKKIKKREKEKEREKEKVKLVNKVHKIHKNSEIKFRDNKSPINSHKHVKKQSFNSNSSTNKKKPFVRVCQEPMSSDISSTGDAGTVGTAGTAGTVLSASRNNDNCDNEIDYDSNRNKYEKIHWLMDDTSCSFDDNLSGRESPVKPVKKNVYFNSDDEDDLSVDMDRRKSYNDKELYIESDPIFDCVPPSPNHLLPVGLEIECTYTRSLARFAAYVGPTAWKIVSNKIQRSLPAGTQFGRGWVGEPEPLSPPFLSLGSSHPIPNPNSKSKSTQPVRNNNSSSGNSASQGLTIGVDQLPRVNNSKVRHERAGPTNAANHHVRKNHSKETVNNNNNNSSPNVFLKPPEVTTPRNANSPNNTNNPFRVSGNAKVSTSNNQGQNRKSAPTTNPMGGFITKQPPPPVNSNTHHQHHHNNNNNGPRLNGLPGQPVTTNRPGTGGTSTSQKGFFMPVQTVKKEAESPKNSTQPPQSWISFGGASYETKPSINVPPPVQVPVPAFLGAQVRPTSISNNAPVWRPVTNSNNPSVSTTTSSSSVNTPTTQYMHVQGQGQGQNGNLMIFPQLVQRDVARFQGQVPSWQGFVPVNQPRQVRETQTLRPDLNIGFNSPVSSPHGQSSGINLEAQQPDLALQL